MKIYFCPQQCDLSKTLNDHCIIIRENCSVAHFVFLNRSRSEKAILAIFKFLLLFVAQHAFQNCKGKPLDLVLKILKTLKQHIRIFSKRSTGLGDKALNLARFALNWQVCTRSLDKILISKNYVVCHKRSLFQVL